MKYEAWQVLEYFVSNIASFLKEWREVLAGAMLCLNNIEWLALLVRSNLIMRAEKKATSEMVKSTKKFYVPESVLQQV